MASFELIRCSIKIQLCIGHFPNGRMRTRTFGIGGVRPDLSADDVAAMARALAPLLAYPIVQVRLVRKYALGALQNPDAAAVKIAQKREAVSGHVRTTGSSSENDQINLAHKKEPPLKYWCGSTKEGEEPQHGG